MRIEQFHVSKLPDIEKYGVYSFGEKNGEPYQSHTLSKNLDIGERITLLSQILPKDLANSAREGIGRVKSYAKKHGIKIKKTRAFKRSGASFDVVAYEKLQKN